LTEKEIEKCGWIGEKVKAGLKAGTDIIWFYDDKIKQIIIMEKPDNFAKSLRGLGKETLTEYHPKYVESWWLQ
jgi:hypothetical protein